MVVQPSVCGNDSITMEEFEGALVDSLNELVSDGIAYRLKQAKWTSQLIDVLVDSPYGYAAIEAKSIKTSSTNKIYFSQHFSEADGVHQVERINNFLDRSGRLGYLAVELRRGRGKSRKAYMIPWKEVRQLYDEGEVGIAINKLDAIGEEIPRNGAEYELREFTLSEPRKK